MGFLKPRPKVESWLRSSSAAMRTLSQAEYQQLIATWKERFEGLLIEGRCLAGARAQRAAARTMPTDVFVFNVPGYRWLPAATDPRFDMAYGYAAVQLRNIQFEVANDFDAIICDRDFTVCCLCTHEEGAFGKVWYVEAGVAGPAL
jgi:hypothetical protein